MKKSELIDLLTSVDVLNTIHGGTSEARLEFMQDKERRQIRLRVPSIDHEKIQVEVHNNVLSIFYFIPVVSNGNMVQLPCLVYNKNVPYYIDVTKIESHSEGQELVVEMPFNESANGYHRQIRMSEE